MHVRAILSCMLVVVVVVVAACAREPKPRAVRVVADARGCVASVDRTSAWLMHGMSFAHSYQDDGARGYGSPTAAASLRELRDDGVDWVSLTPFAFQRTLSDAELRSSASMAGGESLARVRAQIEEAHALGMRVLLKPHVWVGSGEWCARITPEGADGWSRWWRSYAAFLLPWVELASQTGVEAISVGTELSSAIAADPRAMRRLIAETRATYRGKLVYAANWDEVDRVPFWDALDYVGVQLYAPLARRVGESDARMQRRFEASLERVASTARRVGRALVITEIGYTTSERTFLAPHAWPEDLRDVRGDAQFQARAYRIAFASIAARRDIAGVFVWKWFTDPNTNEEGQVAFSPRGRPAAAVMATAYGAPRCRVPRSTSLGL